MYFYQVKTLIECTLERFVNFLLLHCYHNNIHMENSFLILNQLLSKSTSRHAVRLVLRKKKLPKEVIKMQTRDKIIIITHG